MSAKTGNLPNPLYNLTMPMLYRFLLTAFCLFIMGVSPCFAGVNGDPQNNAILYSQQGEALAKLGRDAEAIEYFKAAIRLNPYAALAGPIYNNLGMAYRRVHSYPLALASFQHAFRIQPNYELFYKNMVDTYAEAGSLSDAIADLNDRVADNPDDGEAYYLLGLMAEVTGDMASAQAHFTRFLELKPNAYLTRAAQRHLDQSR